MSAAHGGSRSALATIEELPPACNRYFLSIPTRSKWLAERLALMRRWRRVRLCRDYAERVRFCRDYVRRVFSPSLNWANARLSDAFDALASDDDALDVVDMQTTAGCQKALDWKNRYLSSPRI